MNSEISLQIRWGTDGQLGRELHRELHRFRCLTHPAVQDMVSR